MEFLQTVLTSSVVTTALLAALGWLCRELIQNRLKAAVEHEFNRKLAALQSELRSSEENFKAELRAKEAQIQSLQSGALSAMAGRQMAVDKRRLEAIDQLWSAVNDLSKARGIAWTTSIIKFDEVSKQIATDPKLQEAFKSFGEIDIRADLKEEAWKARPHVSHLAWAYFAAFRSIVALSLSRLYLLQRGLPVDITDHVKVVDMVKVALPHRVAYVEEHGAPALPWLLDELETSLLNEFARMMSGTESDRESVQRAAEIIAVAEAVQMQNREEVVAAGES
ncbi:hypothetical protein J2785_006741 [Burkholderia ambifaria]|nr:hypothetical protein [Burkholderia ambifaria]MDR6503548.1 hypothetical protein [Burkholderia ambifaria]